MGDLLTDYTATEAYDDYTAQDKDSVFGGPEDLWGASEITLTQLRDPSFAVKFDADLGTTLIRADMVKVEIFYTTPGTDAQNALLHPEHQTSTTYAEGDIVWIIADDGIAHQYVSSGGTSDATAPVFTSAAGSTVSDGDITWTEAGQYQPASLPPYYQSDLLSGAIGRDANGVKTFVIVGTKGTVKTSQDGETWTEQDSGVAETLRGVAAGNTGFKAVGDNGRIISSPDGENWSIEASETTDSLFDVDFDRIRGGFSAVGKDGIIRHRDNQKWNTIER